MKESEMRRKIKGIGITIIVLGVICFFIGAAFIIQGFIQHNVVIGAMDEEKISMGPFGGDSDNIMNTLEEAQRAGDTVREHRHSIAPSYESLLGNEKYDPTNPVQLTYAQAMNLENYLYLAVASIGLVDVILATGGFMVIVAIALGLTGGTLIYISPKL
jgi:hypothetical protein